jgi:hypothetical protein
MYEVRKDISATVTTGTMLEVTGIGIQFTE